MGTLDGKRALVTGAASGIGKAIATAFAAEGAHVAIVDRAPKRAGDKVAASIAANGGRAFAVQADIADEAQVLRLFKAALKKLGGLDILVNNAGILIEKPLLETTAADFDRLIGVNLRGAFLVGREALRVMAAAEVAGASSISPRSLPISAARTARSTAPRRAACSR